MKTFVRAGVPVNPGDIIAADEDGVAVIPRAKAADVSIKEAVKQFGRI
jgi:regulator of RNase E activity RraA